MALTDVATAEGIRTILRAPESVPKDLGPYVEAADRRLKQEIGTTNYAAVLAQTLTEAEVASAVRAANLFGAALYYGDAPPPVGARGVMADAAAGQMSNERFATSDDITKQAVRWRLAAIQELKVSGLWQRPTNPALFQRIDVDETDA